MKYPCKGINTVQLVCLRVFGNLDIWVCVFVCENHILSLPRSAFVVIEGKQN